MVVAQIALSLALLIAAGLFARFAGNMTGFDSGYRADHTLIADLDAGLAGYDETRGLQAYSAIEENLARLPGVQSASIGAIAPFGFVNIFRDVRRAGVAVAPDARPATVEEGRAFGARWNAIGADYFTTMGVPLRAGRPFTRAEANARGAPPVAIIDEVLAKKLWPEGNALGQRIQFARREPGATGPGHDESMEIVGIARATRDDAAQQEAGNSLYVPFAQGYINNVHFHVRPVTAGSDAGAALLDAVRRTLRETAPGVPVFTLRTFAQHRDSSIELWGVRMLALLFSVFSILTLLVAIVGLYGIKAYVVSRRTREIGIRMALGAEPGAVLRLILREGMSLTLLGAGLGLALGAGLGRVLASLFHELPAFDPAAFGLATLALLAAAFLACWLPARRATRVNPLTALRSE